MTNYSLLDFIYLDYEEVSEDMFNVVFKYNSYITSSESRKTDYYRTLVNGVVIMGKIMNDNQVNHYFIERK